MYRDRWIILPFLLIVLFFLSLSTGSVSIPIGSIFNIIVMGDRSEPAWAEIILNIRMTKTLTCMLAGGALALAGLQMQTLFRNALAGPDVLGLSSGASLAVSFLFMSQSFIAFSFSSSWATAIAASIGCMLVFILMISVSRRIDDNVSLLIVGLMIGAATSSIVSVLQYLSRAEEMQVFMIWTFGSLSGLNWSEIAVLTFVLITGTILSFINVKSLNAWLLGDLYAASIGIRLQSARVWIIISTSLLTGAVTSFCGPIAFVGLAVPHLVKLIFKTSNHLVLIPAVIAGGAILLLFCDVVSQLPQDYTLPINAITALVGAPVVIWVLLSKRRLQV